MKYGRLGLVLGVFGFDFFFFGHFFLIDELFRGVLASWRWRSAGAI